jgi:hypothetical protein
MSAAIFNRGAPYATGTGTCSQAPLAPGDGAGRGNAQGAALAHASGNDKCHGANTSVRIDNDRLRAHCAQFNGVFAQQCERVSQAIWKALKKKKERKSKQVQATRSKFEAAILKTGSCRASSSSSAGLSWRVGREAGVSRQV